MNFRLSRWQPYSVSSVLILQQTETHMQNEIIFLVSESPEGGFEARALGHSVFTEADTVEELRGMVKDAVACHFEEAERPAVIRLHFVREEVLAA
jgi:hypothetical protein